MEAIFQRGQVVLLKCDVGTGSKCGHRAKKQLAQYVVPMGSSPYSTVRITSHAPDVIVPTKCISAWPPTGSAALSVTLLINTAKQLGLNRIEQLVSKARRKLLCEKRQVQDNFIDPVFDSECRRCIEELTKTPLSAGETCYTKFTNASLCPSTISVATLKSQDGVNRYALAIRADSLLLQEALLIAHEIEPIQLETKAQCFGKDDSAVAKAVRESSEYVALCEAMLGKMIIGPTLDNLWLRDTIRALTKYGYRCEEAKESCKATHKTIADTRHHKVSPFPPDYRRAPIYTSF